MHGRATTPSTSRRRKFVATTALFAIVSSLLIAIAAAPASAAVTTVVKPSNMNGWYFYNDATSAPGGPGEMVSGPATPPMGAGSVRLGPLTAASGDGAHATIATNDYFGTQLSDITNLSYSSYQPGPVLAVALQFDVRYRTTDTLYGGRLVFEPYQNGAVTVGAGWQSWSPLAGTWWASRTTAAGTGGVQVVPLPAGNCAQATPCTWAEINASFPDAAVYGRLLLKAGSNWLGFDGNADALTIGVSGTDETFDFEAETQCTSVCYVDAVNGNDAFGGDTPASAKKTIQAAINQVDAGGQVRVLPGNYDETAAGSDPTSLGGAYQFGLFFKSDKPGVTVMGVDGSDDPITDPSATQATITTNATNNFGYSGIFVEAPATTIQGVEIGPNDPGDNKTIEVVADNFTLKDVNTSVPNGGGSIYINDFSAGGTVVQSYHVIGNRFDDGTSVDISSGAGNNGPVSGREILNNTFDLNDNGFNGVSFNGSGGVAWFVNPVGGAIITGNDFSNSTQYIRARGDYHEEQFDWESYWNDNTYDRAAVALVTESPFDVRSYAYSSFVNVRRIGGTIQGEVDHTVAGDTVLVKEGTYAEHVTLDRDITVKGANAGTVGNGARGAESRITGANSGAVQITADGVTLDGFEISSASNNLGAGIHMSAAAAGALIENNVITGNQIGIYANSDGPSTITQNLFDANNEPGSSGGSGIYSEFTNGLTVDDNEFANHTTNNPMIFAATGPGVHTDLTVSNNLVHDNDFGVFAVGVDGGDFTGNDISAAGATALSFSGGNTDIQVTKNLLHDSARGVRVQDFGYGLGADSDIHVNRNSITNNTAYAVGNVSGYTGTLDAECNWYGALTGPAPGAISGDVDATPWLTSSDLDGPCFSFTFQGFFQPIDNNNLNVAKAGQTIPVKWRLLLDGVPVSDSSSFVSLTSSPVNCKTLAGENTDPIETYVSTSGLDYHGDGNWQYNWKTPKTLAGKCRTMVLSLSDGSTHEADFQFK